MSSVKIFTLKTTQTLIGTVVEESINEFKVKLPVQIVIQPGKEGDINLAFAPFLEFAEEFKSGISFPKDAILTVNTPATELLNEYSRIFGAGIQVAKSMPKL
jgi:hypothetical protein